MPTLDFNEAVMDSLAQKLDGFSALLEPDEQRALAGVMAAGWANVDEVQGFSYEEPDVEGFKMNGPGSLFKVTPRATDTGGCVLDCVTAGSSLAQCLYYCTVVNPY